MNQQHVSKNKQDHQHHPGMKQVKPVVPAQAADHPILQAQGIIGNHGVLQRYGFPMIQAKLKIGEPNDAYEQEADRVADAVMQMPDPHIQRKSPWNEDEEDPIQMKPAGPQITPLVQKKGDAYRKEDDEDEPIQMKEVAGEGSSLVQRRERREDDEDEPIQMKAKAGGNCNAPSNLVTSINAMRGGGEPLPGSARAFFEPRFGCHFGEVRIHTGAKSSESAKKLNAQAYTVNENIFFDHGRYSPDTPKGKKLLAHELTHVCQQAKLANQANKHCHGTGNWNSNSDIGIQKFGGRGHESATDAELSKLFTKEQMMEIQFGNWKTDMNQISMAIPIFKKLRIPLTMKNFVDIIRILAIDKFGEGLGGKLDSDSLGEYQTAEHFDNPQGDIEKESEIQSFINDYVANIQYLVKDTIRLKDTSAGRDRLGYILHIIQDFYAHSNFVEIALNLVGKDKIDTMGGRTSSKQFILTSGEFSGLDTFISIAKIIAEKLNEPTKKEGKLTAGERIAVIILNQCNYREVTSLFLKYRTGKETVKKEGESLIPMPVEETAHYAYMAFESAMQLISKALHEAIIISTNQLAKKTGKGKHPSHSKLAKDSASDKRKLYPYAIKLATFVTSTIGKKVRHIWELNSQKNNPASAYKHEEELLKLITVYLNHPEKNGWWRSHIKVKPKQPRFETMAPMR